MEIYKVLICVLLVSFLTFHCGEGKKSRVLSLTSDTWRQTLEGQWMIKFYAPWCPACRAMESDYKEFATWSDDLDINVAEVNINDEPGLSGRFIVTALPSLYHSRNGEFRRYTGARDTNSLHKYIEEEIWRGVEPVAWYRHPDSIPMALMSGLFQTSVIMKNFHEMLTETYGFSTNMSYVIFAVVTIITGLVLGLIMVFIIDCVAPPKRNAKEATVPITPPTQAEEDNKSDEEGEVETEDEKASVGTASSHEASDAEEEGKKAQRRGSQDASSEEEDGERRSSQSSSRTSQEWEQVQGEEAEEAKLETEKSIPDEEGQGEVRRRVKSKPDKDE